MTKNYLSTSLKISNYKDNLDSYLLRQKDKIIKIRGCFK